MSEIKKQNDDAIMEKIRKDLTNHLPTRPLAFKLWVGFLLTIIGVALWGYVIQFNNGLLP